jgi:DNA-binding transcriptional MocR family regulator
MSSIDTATATALSTRALYEEVAELLRQRIFNRELEPGSWIDELRLAQELGISRTPLREALKVLATEGLTSITCWPCWKATPRAWWPPAPPMANAPSCKRCTASSKHP